MKTPDCYYSTGDNLWSLILRGQPLCKPGSFEDAQRCAKSFKLSPDLHYWDGSVGEFKVFK